MNAKTIAMWLVVIGGLNWLLIGLLGMNVIDAVLGGVGSWLPKLVYILVGLSALWSLVDMMGKGAKKRA